MGNVINTSLLGVVESNPLPSTPLVVSVVELGGNDLVLVGPPYNMEFVDRHQLMKLSHRLVLIKGFFLLKSENQDFFFLIKHRSCRFSVRNFLRYSGLVVNNTVFKT